MLRFKKYKQMVKSRISASKQNLYEIIDEISLANKITKLVKRFSKVDQMWHLEEEGGGEEER